MNKFVKIFVAITIFCNFSFIFSQSLNLRFDSYTVDDGLSQTTANTIYQDKYGFMWFGTQDGLNRFDGYNFKVFTADVSNKNSLSNNYIWSIYEDNNNIIWLGSFGGGLTRFDPSTETFTHFKMEGNNKQSLSSNDIFSIDEYPEGILWLRTGIGINKFDKESNKVTQYLVPDNKVNKNSRFYISSLEIQKPDYVWAGTDSGLVKLNIKTGTHEFFQSDPINGKIKFGNIYDLEFSDNILFVCCDSGLIKIDFDKKLVNRRLIPQIIDNRLTRFNHLLVDKNYFWIGTNNGLLLFDNKRNTTRRFYHKPEDPFSLNHNNVVSLYKSKEGILWIGTYGGINKLNKLKEDFKLIQYDPSNENTISNKSVGPIMEDKNGIVWIGTPDGLNSYNRSSGKIITYKNIPDDKNSLSSNYILFILQDSKENIWIGTRGGGVNKFRYNKLSELSRIKFERVAPGKLNEISDRIQSIFEDSKGIIWLGTGGKGLIRFEPNTENIKWFPPATDGSGPSHTFIYSMLEDSKSNFWIGTPTGGLNLFDRNKEKFIYIKNKDDDIKSLSNDIVLSVFEDSKNQLWICTSGGLNKLNIQVEKYLFRKLEDSTVNISFIKFGRNDGLPNEVIYGILEDDNGNFWFGTNKGLVKFNPSSSDPVLKVFDVSDGLQNNEFNQNSFYKNKDGEMYFGGLSGFNIFHPDSIKPNQNIPPVYLTDFKLFNKSVPLENNSKGDEYSLNESIYMKDQIDLSYNQNVLTFEFAALNYILPEKNQYVYKMEGFDENWIHSGTRRTVTYTNLDPGEYFFRVKASNNDGIWNEEGTVIKLSISPPPWLSWYAYLFYGLFFAAGMFLFIRIRINAARREFETQTKIDQAKLQEREEVRRKSSADFHDEAGNKLTKITLFTELAKSEAKENKPLNEYLAKIEENTKELSTGMRDFIWVLDPQKDSLFDTINRLQDFGNSMFNFSNINFSVSGVKSKFKNIILSIDSRRAILLIFKEAMNNCLKYSCAKNVELIIETSNENLIITLFDNGKGFDKTEIKSGYGLKNMKERATKINSELLITSVKNKGTEVCLKGNITHMSN